MKKIWSLLLCVFVVCALLVGCSNIDADYISLRKSDTILIFDKGTLEGDSKYLTSIYPFSNKVGFVSYDKRFEDELYPKSYFGFYNMDSQQLVEIGNYYPWVVASWDYCLIMNNRYLYFTALFLTGENYSKEQVSMLRMDILEKKLEVIKIANDEKVYPLIHMSKLNETEFIAHIVIREKSDNETNEIANTTQIVKFNSETGESKTIIEYKYSYVLGDADSNGILLESVCGIDNTIYAVGRRMEGNKWSYYLYVFDDHGNMLTEIEAPALAQTMEDKITQTFYVVGNYFTLGQYETGRQALYRIIDNKVEVVITLEERIIFPNMSNLYDSKKNPYIYYSTNWSIYEDLSSKKTESNPIYALNITTGEVKSISVDIDKERPYLDYLIVDENGNLIIALIEQEFGDKMRGYYISYNTLKELLD